jgi:hypothetical protein
MKSSRISMIIIFALFRFLFSQTAYEKYFTGDALRIDYFHSGSKDEEKISIDQLYQVTPWAGSRENLIDTLNAGYYMVRVIDGNTNNLIYSYGFSTLFNEWQTTQEALQGDWKTIHETILIPYPKHEIQLEFWSRDRKSHFSRLIFNSRIDPGSYSVNKEDRASGVIKLDSIITGDYSQKVDLAVIGEGFTSTELPEFLNIAKSLTDTMFTIEPFKDYSQEFNIYFIIRPSQDSGTDDPSKGIFNNTALNTSFNTFESQRYLMTFDTKSIHDIASIVPYDAIIIIVNSETYGGGGIYNFYASTSAFNEWSPYVYVHEFGHSFAGLADEYYTSDVAYSEFYPADTEPWETNITPLMDPKNVKWANFVDPEIPIPTPWDKEKFDKTNKEYRKKLKQMTDEKAPSSEIAKLKENHQKWLDEFFVKRRYAGKTGAFEGAGYASKGLYRPAVNCIMFSKGLSGFDAVCKSTIERRIQFLTK